ncbi:DUF4123 domain-containing protein [Pseudomonas sp. NPDC007930]|uniref:DUF4123 domain-containing protein n=1 Tax=Pseudomonas sp. NPDC007930 TaxID=3364417 RepID=UPI0036ECF73B
MLLNTPAQQAWLQQLERACACYGHRHLDVIVDQACWEQPLLPAIGMLQPPLPCFSLFQGLPEQRLEHLAPLLMRIDLNERRHKAWLAELARHLWALPGLLVLFTPLAFSTLSTTLRGLAQFDWAGQVGLLRYFDTRVWPVLLDDVLSEAQQARFTQVALGWAWLDRDQQPILRHGTWRHDLPTPEEGPPLVLSDEQLDRLLDVRDAEGLMALAGTYCRGATQQARFALCLELAREARTQGWLGNLEMYAGPRLEARWAAVAATAAGGQPWS